MTIPLRNIVHDMVKEAKSINDVDLYKTLQKKSTNLIPNDKFNKVLLDLEILGLIKVSWVTKEERRVEINIIKKEEDSVKEQNEQVMENDYEASFPGFEK